MNEATGMGLGSRAPYLSDEELQRYNRHLVLQGFGLEAQKKIKAASVLIVGAGGLGSPASLYLAAAGVGRLGLVDFDVVDRSNLQRQVIYDVSQLGLPKVEAAKAKLAALNPHVHVEVHHEKLSPENAISLFERYDLIIDGSDNFPTRYLVNDACVLCNKPFIYGAIFQFEGQVAVFNVNRADGTKGPNYRDLYPDPPGAGTVPACAEGGVLGVLPGIIGSMQALESIKLIAGIGSLLDGRFYMFDALHFESRTIRIKPNPANPLNNGNVNALLHSDYEAYCATTVIPSPAKEVTAAQLIRMLETGEDVQLIDVREPQEYNEINIGGLSIPLGTIIENSGKIAPGGPVVLHCKSGSRSLRAIKLLEQQFGFSNLYNLKGGLAAYLEVIKGRGDS